MIGRYERLGSKSWRLHNWYARSSIVHHHWTLSVAGLAVYTWHLHWGCWRKVKNLKKIDTECHWQTASKSHVEIASVAQWLWPKLCWPASDQNSLGTSLAAFGLRVKGRSRGQTCDPLILVSSHNCYNCYFYYLVNTQHHIEMSEKWGDGHNTLGQGQGRVYPSPKSRPGQTPGVEKAGNVIKIGRSSTTSRDFTAHMSPCPLPTTRTTTWHYSGARCHRGMQLWENVI